MPTATVIAFDKASARRVDEQGFLHVDGCNISKATVNPYYGSEIPNWEQLKLDPQKIYHIYRPAEELERAAATFNNLPLMDVHVEVSAFDLEDPEIKKHLVGCTGSGAEFKHPYLVNSLAVHTAGAIEGIMSKEQSELSCAYRYEIVMEPGEFEGAKYDGRMTNLRGNHVAIVVEGRAGPDVVVADEKPSKLRVAVDLTGIGKATAVAIKQAMAQDKSVRGARAGHLVADDADEVASEPCELAEQAAMYAGRLAMKEPKQRYFKIAGELYKIAAKEHMEAGFTDQAAYHVRQATWFLNQADLFGPGGMSVTGDIAKPEDVNPSRGITEYGEVQFADQKNKKYPIDTEDHVRAALTYWGRQKNKNQYSKEDQTKITKRIETAAKKFKIGKYAEGV